MSKDNKVKAVANSNPQTLAAANSSSDPLQLAVLEKLNQALKAYELKRSTILQKAMDEGGMEAVAKIEDEYRALNDAYFELLRSSLAVNGAMYEQVMEEAKNVTAKIKEKIESLQSALDLMNNIAATINLVGRILILFGI